MSLGITPSHETGHGAAPDVKLLAVFVKEFNVLTRHSRNYPKGHPIIETFVGRTLQAHARLMESCENVSLAMAKDTLMLDSVALDRGNIVFRDFARSFFDRGIGTVSILPGLTADQLKRILLIFRVKREELSSHGGIEEVWQKAKITSIQIRMLRFELFTNTEDGLTRKAGEMLWERLARGLLENTLNPDGTPYVELDPEIVADIFNARYEDNGCIPDAAEIMDMLVREEAAEDAAVPNPVLYAKLGALVSRLQTDLRYRFLCSCTETGRPDGSKPIADLIDVMDPESILGILHDPGNGHITPPPLLMQLVQKLASHTSPEQRDATQASETTKEELTSLFREHAYEQYVPPEYQRKLQSMIAFQGETRSADELGDLLKSLDAHNIQHRLGEIILQLAGQGGDERDLLLLSQNMEEMCLYLLQTGEYHEVLLILRRAMDPIYPDDFRERFRASVSQPEFLAEILNGLTIWGKSRYDDISALIRAIGAPFVEPLLERLGTEERISFRRFLIDRLVDLGPLAQSSLVARLDDPRWYFVRNIIIVLRSIGDPTVAPHLRPLLKHSNDVISQEALRSLQEYGDPAADRQIAINLESLDRKTQLAAIQHAHKSRSTDVVRNLSAIVTRSGLSQSDIELKCAAVQALGEIGDPSVLDDLARVLASSTLIRAKALMRLKEVIVRSLALYPPRSALPILEPIAQGGNPLGRLAAVIERTIKAETHEE